MTTSLHTQHRNSQGYARIDLLHVTQSFGTLADLCPRLHEYHFDAYSMRMYTDSHGNY